MDVSENSGIPKSSILIRFSIINHPFLGYHYFRKHPYGSWNINMFDCQLRYQSPSEKAMTQKPE